MTDLTGTSPGVQTPIETTSKCWKAIRVPLYAVLTILSAALQSVSFKKAGYSLMSFPYIILLVVAFSFIPILFLFVFYIDKTYGILKESKTVEVKKTFAVLGFLNALNGVLIIFQNPHVSGIVQSALAQAVIPTTLVLSVLILKVSFSKFQYIGAFVVFVGIFVEFIPYLQTSAQQSSTVASKPFFVLTFLSRAVTGVIIGYLPENCVLQIACKCCLHDGVQLTRAICIFGFACSSKFYTIFWKFYATRILANVSKCFFVYYKQLRRPS